MGWLRPTIEASLKAALPYAPTDTLYKWAHDFLNDHMETLLDHILQQSGVYGRSAWEHECRTVKDGAEKEVRRHALVIRMLNYAPPDWLDGIQPSEQAALPSILRACSRKHVCTGRASGIGQEVELQRF